MQMKTRPHARLVSRSFLQCAAVFTAAFTLGLGTAFVARLGAPAQEPVIAPLETSTPTAPPLAVLAAPSDAAISTAPDAAAPAASAPAAEALELVGFEPLAPLAAPAPAIDHDRIYTSGVIARGETLAYALGEQGIPRLTVHQITTELSRHFDFRRAQPGHPYRLAQDAEGRVVEFRYSTSPMEGYHARARRRSLRRAPRRAPARAA